MDVIRRIKFSASAVTAYSADTSRVFGLSVENALLLTDLYTFQILASWPSKTPLKFNSGYWPLPSVVYSTASASTSPQKSLYIFILRSYVKKLTKFMINDCRRNQFSADISEQKGRPTFLHRTRLKNIKNQASFPQFCQKSSSTMFLTENWLSYKRPRRNRLSLSQTGEYNLFLYVKYTDYFVNCYVTNYFAKPNTRL